MKRNKSCANCPISMVCIGLDDKNFRLVYCPKFDLKIFVPPEVGDTGMSRVCIMTDCPREPNHECKGQEDENDPLAEADTAEQINAAFVKRIGRVPCDCDIKDVMAKIRKDENERLEKERKAAMRDILNGRDWRDRYDSEE